ncbi:MAG: ATP-binding protein [Planctomycetota bacterium]|nr:ATP-binding protein [Planctomycetota bacterium]
MNGSSPKTATAPSAAPPEPTGPAELRVEMLSQPRYLSGARDLVSAVAKRLGFDDQSCGQIALAVDEALCNVIRHGYDRRPDGRIWLSIWPVEHSPSEPLGMKIVIEDEAKQIDPESIRGRDLEDVRPGGLGVHIIRQVMNTVRYEKREKAGMRLVLVKTHAGPDDRRG